MNTIQRIIKNTASLLFGGIIAQFLGFIAIVYLARILGPEGFGKINYAIAIVVSFAVITNLGLTILGAREVARGIKKVKDYVSSIVALRLCLASLSFVLLLIFTAIINKSPEMKYLILLYGLGLFPTALLFDWVFQGIQKMEYIGASRILNGVVYLGLVLLLVKSSKQLHLIPLFQTGAAFLAVGLLISIFLKRFGGFRLRFKLINLKNLLREALPLGIALVMIQIIYNIDTVMLGFMKSDVEVGYYSAAYKIIPGFIMIGNTYFDAIFPLLSNYYKTSLDLLEKLQRYTARLTVSLALPIATGVTILAKPIMNFLYGSKYDDGIIALQILMWAVALIYVNSVYARGMLACDRQKEFLVIVSVQAVANIGLNLILIPSLGIVGAAISACSAELLGFFFYYRGFNKVVPVHIHNYILKPLLASGMMTFALLWGIHLNLFLLIFGGGLIYLISLYVFKGITREDIISLQSIIPAKWNKRNRKDI